MNFLLLLLAAPLLLAASSGFAQPIAAQSSAAEVSPDYRRARQAFDVGQFREAAGLFASVAAHEQAIAPERRSDALLMEATCLARLHDYAPAETVLRAYLQQSERSSAALYLMGNILQRENKPRDSLEVFTRAAAIVPPTPEDLRVVALDYVLLDDYADAGKWLLRAVEGDPRNEAAWYDLGRVRMHDGNFVEAERAFRRALLLQPADSKALNNLGLSLEAQNRVDEALAAYERAIQAQSATPHPSEQPLLNYGALLNTRLRSADAISPLRRATEIAPDSSRCHEELARAYLGAHQETLAQAEMERAVALDPKNPRLHFQLGQIYRHAGSADRAEQELRRSAELYGNKSSVPEP